MLLIHASALTTLAVKFPFSFEKPHFGSVQERSLLPLWIGRTLEKQLPQSHFFRKIRKANHVNPLILKIFQILVCLKLAPSGNTLIFGPIPFRPRILSLTLLLKAKEFLSLICLSILLFPIDLPPSSLKILLTRPFQS